MRSVLPVKEYEACNETEVEKKNHNNRGNDGGLRTADVARVSNIWNSGCSIFYDSL